MYDDIFACIQKYSLSNNVSLITKNAILSYAVLHLTCSLITLQLIDAYSEILASEQARGLLRTDLAGPYEGTTYVFPSTLMVTTLCYSLACSTLHYTT